jgi:hypothetical protein
MRQAAWEHISLREHYSCRAPKSLCNRPPEAEFERMSDEAIVKSFEEQANLYRRYGSEKICPELP